MTVGRRTSRRTLRAAAAVLMSAVGLAGVAVPATAEQASGQGVTMTVVDQSPAVPATSSALSPLTFTIRLTNAGDTTVTDLRVQATRGYPIGTQAALDSSLATTSTTVTGGIAIPATHPVRITSLAPGASTTVRFTTTTGLPSSAGLCLCGNDVYPVYLGAYSADGSTEYASTRTWVSSVYQSVDRMSVGWLWPLVDRPHRLLSATQFVDDDLTTSLSGGRLDRALQTVQDVVHGDADFPLTLLVDPELLSEIEVMADGRYTVLQSDGSTVVGDGQVAAVDWLDRLRQVLAADPSAAVALTPYADPDVTSLTGQKLSYSTALPSSVSADVARALAGTATTASLSVPANGTISSRALTTEVGAGISSIVLSATSVTPSVVGGSPTAVGVLRSAGRSVTALLTSAAVQEDAAQALAFTPNGTTATPLPRLLAELAVRVDAAPTQPHAVLITAPRYVDPSDPAAAAQAVLSTARSAFATPAALGGLRGAASASSATSSASATVPRVRVRRDPAGSSTLAPAILSGAATSGSLIAGARSLLARDPNADSFLAELAPALQRTESSAWLPSTGSGAAAPNTTSIGGGTVAGTAFTDRLTSRLQSLMQSVHIVRPSTSDGSYTLASSNSPLPITVDNSSQYTVVVRLEVHTVGNVPGLVSRTINAVELGPDSKQTLHVPTEVQRSGQIQVRAVLSTTNGQLLGEPVELDVHSTVFGLIGIVITAVAGGILALALAVRYVRRLRRRASRSKRPVRFEARAIDVSAVTS